MGTRSSSWLVLLAAAGCLSDWVVPRDMAGDQSATPSPSDMTCQARLIDPPSPSTLSRPITASVLACPLQACDKLPSGQPGTLPCQMAVMSCASRTNLCGTRVSITAGELRAATRPLDGHSVRRAYLEIVHMRKYVIEKGAMAISGSSKILGSVTQGAGAPMAVLDSLVAPDLDGSTSDKLIVEEGYRREEIPIALSKDDSFEDISFELSGDCSLVTAGGARYELRWSVFDPKLVVEYNPRPDVACPGSP